MARKRKQQPDDSVMTKGQRIYYDAELKSMDVTLAGPIEIRVRRDKKVIWINEGGRCLVRICGIEGPIHWTWDAEEKII